MQSLNAMVLAGKVLYLGISDTPAWVVSKANEYARQNGLRQFSVYQGRWSAEHRDFERDIIPMCKVFHLSSLPVPPDSDFFQDEGMGLAPWGALGGGNFKSRSPRIFNFKRPYKKGFVKYYVVDSRISSLAGSANPNITR